MIEIIERHENHLNKDRYKLTCRKCGSIMTLSNDDFDVVEESYGETSRKFICPVCNEAYYLRFPEVRKLFEEIKQ